MSGMTDPLVAALPKALVFPAMIILSAGLALALIPLARRVGLVDHPGDRKVHQHPTPLTGGPAIFITLALYLFWQLADDPFAQAVLAGGGLVFLAGLADDRRHLSPWVRIIVQVTACLVIVYWGGVRLGDFGQLFTASVLGLGPIAVPITIFAALGVINAFNMIDGMDGLSGGIFMVATAALALYAGFHGAAHLHWMLVAALSAVLGFLLLNARLPWNPRARVFLGDSGSTLLGFLLAWSFIALGNDFNETGRRAYMPMTAVWLFAVPLMDTSTLIWRRVRGGRSPLSADQHHLHHAFLRAGYSTGQAWFGIIAFAVALAAVGTLFEISGLPDYFSFWAFVAVAMAYFLAIHHTWVHHRFLGRDFIDEELGPKAKKAD